MDSQPYLRSQDDLLADLRALMRDPAGQRWSDEEIYRAINRALLSWHGRVAVNHYYTLPGGYSSATYAYSLPGYIRPPVVAEVKRWIPYTEYTLDVQTTFTWQELPSFTEPDGAGGLILRLVQPPRNLDGRVRWRLPNGPVPLALAELGESCALTADSLTLTGDVDIADAGYVKCENEWMAYAGVTRGSATVLQNLLRGLYGTTAAAHNDGEKVAWGVAVDSLGLFQQLYDQTAAHLHELYLTDGNEKERMNHEKMMGFHQQRADEFWRRYLPAVRQGSLQTNQRAVLR